METNTTDIQTIQQNQDFVTRTANNTQALGDGIIHHSTFPLISNPRDIKNNSQLSMSKYRIDTKASLQIVSFHDASFHSEDKEKIRQQFMSMMIKILRQPNNPFIITYDANVPKLRWRKEIRQIFGRCTIYQAPDHNEYVITNIQT